MVAVEHIVSQRLFARNDDDTVGPSGAWGPVQIATPAIIGGVLLLAFVVYILWQRGLLRRRPYDYHPVRSDWVNKIPCMFIPRKRRHRVYRSSDPLTLDDSMRTSGLVLELGRAPQIRTGSYDSQTPLTQTTRYPFDFEYPPENSRLSESPPPIARRPSIRWWRVFGSRPHEVRSEEPGSRWRIDGPDGSTSGHDHSSHGHERHSVRHAGASAVVPGNPREEVEGSVLRIGGDFRSIASTMMTHLFPEQVRAARGMPTVPEQSSSSGARTPVPAISASQSGRSTPVPSAHRGFPPSYEDSQGHWGYPSEEDLLRLARSQSHMIVQPPVPAAGHSSPRTTHERQASSDSFLTAQPPMVTASVY